MNENELKELMLITEKMLKEEIEEQKTERRKLGLSDEDYGSIVELRDYIVESMTKKKRSRRAIKKKLNDKYMEFYNSGNWFRDELIGIKFIFMY